VKLLGTSWIPLFSPEEYGPPTVNFGTRHF
jgi:hypothetical protein